MDVRKSRLIVFLAIANPYRFFFVFEIFDQMDAGDHFGCPKITFDRISGHFRSIRNFFVVENFDKMAAGSHLGWDGNVNYRTRPIYLDEQWMCQV